MPGVQGRRALVLCGTRGIGFGVAQALARQGAAVTVTGTDPGRADAAAKALPGTGHSAFACDFRDPAGVGAAVAASAAESGHYDVVLLNSPGAAPGPVEELGADRLQQALDLMLLSLQQAVAVVLPAMRENGWGRLIAITSTSVETPISALAASSIARAAVQSYLKLLAERVGRYGITVNHVLPGKIDTDRLRAVEESQARTLGVDAATVRDRTRESIPVGRYGTPEDVGELVAFLAGEQAGYITGTGIRCDGGFLQSL